MNTLCTTSHPAAPRMLYSRNEAAHQLCLSVRAIDYLIANKKLAIRRVGKKVLVPHGELVRFARVDHFETVRPA